MAHKSKAYIWHISDITHAYLRLIVGISQKFMRHISVTSRLILGMAKELSKNYRVVQFQPVLTGVIYITTRQCWVEAVKSKQIPSQEYLRYISAISQPYLCHASGLSQVYHRYTLCKYQAYLSYISCTSWVFLRYISGI